MSPNVLCTVLVVEDETAILELIVLNLRHAGFTVIACGSSEDAEKEIAKQLPDVLIIDWMLPKKSGLELAQQLRAAPRTKALPMIMLTARAQEEDRVLGLDAGFDDYVVKPFSPKELVARVKALLRRRLPHLSDAIISAGSLNLNPLSHEVKSNQQLIEMNPSEFRLLHFLMAHPERVFSRNALLNELWGDHVFIEERTIDVHIRRVRSALEPFGEDQRIETVRGAGYRFLTR